MLKEERLQDSPWKEMPSVRETYTNHEAFCSSLMTYIFYQTPAKASKRGEKKGERLNATTTVTGGAGTLALAAARALLEHGLPNLYLLDLETTLTSSAASISTLRSDFPESSIYTLAVDVTDASLVTTAFDTAANHMGSIDILLCFAGIVGCVPAISMTPEQWRKTLDVNCTGSFLCAQAAANHMVRQKTGGSIVMTASISAHRVNFPQPQVAYNVSKAAVLAMKDSLAAEWAV